MQNVVIEKSDNLHSDKVYGNNVHIILNTIKSQHARCTELL
jgi:hypothetical protein